MKVPGFLSLQKMNKKILIIDIETTDFLQRGGKIVEIGIVELCLETFTKKIIFNEVMHEEGITKDDLENSWIIQNSTLTLEDVFASKSLDFYKEKIQHILNSYPNGATAFNNAFDFGFMEDRGFQFPKKLDCPMKLSTDICKIPHSNGRGYKWPKVEEAHKYFFGDVGYIEQHRGADDAFHEADIVYALSCSGVFKLN